MNSPIVESGPPPSTSPRIKISVVIPYFQREAGILRRALDSVLRQSVPPGTAVHIVIVDDGSPMPAHAEVSGLAVGLPFNLTIISQPNRGVAAARNTGLTSLDEATRYIAFLDSDDMWHEDHLAQAIGALEQGRDFYFCDNTRPGHHPSQFRESLNLTAPIIERYTNAVLIDISPAEAFTLILKDFPGQASTTLYRRACAPKLMFEQALKTSGEDMLFYLALARAATRVCFSPRVMVECGRGVNIYFDHLGWDAPGHFTQTMGRLLSHTLVRQTIPMDRPDTRFNNRVIAVLRRKIAFLTLRDLFKKDGRWQADLGEAMRTGRGAMIWLPISLCQVIAGRATGLYKPD